MPARSLAALFAAAMLPLFVLACWRAPAAGRQAERLDGALRRVIVEHPDSVVGLLIRTTAPLTQAQRAQLEADSIRVNSVVGTIATARARARFATRLADVPFVVHVQLAATIPGPGAGAAAGPRRRHLLDRVAK